MLRLTHCEDPTFRGRKIFWEQRAKECAEEVNKGVFKNQNLEYVKDFQALQEWIIKTQIKFWEGVLEKDKLNVLDVGCGWGRLAPFISKHANYKGIDFCENFIKQADPRYDIRQMDVRKPLDFCEGEFDLAFMVSCVSSTESEFTKICDNIKRIAKALVVIEEHWYMVHWPQEMISKQEKWG